MNPLIINNFNRRKEFIEMLKERRVTKGVEVGVDHGKYAQQLLAGVPGLMLYLVDPWLAYTEGTEVHTQPEVDQIFEEAKDRVRSYIAPVMRMTSMDAVHHFTDNSLDFVFIDGNHSYENVLEDITEWSKKVKPGGIIAGHDYKEDKVNNYGVIEAVQKYTQDNHISPWFVLRSEGRYVDCYMWIKQ